MTPATVFCMSLFRGPLGETLGDTVALGDTGSSQKSFKIVRKRIPKTVNSNPKKPNENHPKIE